MGYELVEQIGVSDYCLTYVPEDRTMYVRHYVQRTDEDPKAGGDYTKKPLSPKKSFDELTPRSADFQFIMNQLKNSRNSTMQIMAKSKEFGAWIESALINLQSQYMEWLDGAEERREKELKEQQDAEQEALEEIVSDGHSIIEEMQNPMICIAWMIDWLTAGERMNILYAFLAYSSQVILKNPISVIGIGEGGSGKTHIQDVALSMIPDQFVMTIKSTTDAALFGFCDEDPEIFDGKIVNIGDMGGKNDHMEAQNFKNAMKELQSDGYMARIKQVPVQGPDGKAFVNQTYELFGYPCLTYTNVPGFDFEDQEKSRSIFYQPRLDNDDAVSTFKTLCRMKGTRTTEILHENQKKVEDIKKMLIALRHRMEYVNIYNPYNDFMRKFLGSSKYFKRDVDKYDGILRVITAINGYRREIIDDTLFTTKEDICIFLDILSRYHESITSNLTPGATDLLHELRDKAEEWDLYEEGITVNDYLYRSSTNISKKTVQNYFGELNAEGRVKVARKEDRANVYILSDPGFSVVKSEIELSDLDKKILDFNYDPSVYDLLSVVYDTPGIFSQPPTQPVWNDYLPENRR